ncbi:DUF2515 family protein [Paenibacillus taiwanensis]|uniref:DUF2515 family protein n=1 Tax=Paenibacillus taiwanensis TaxID=401638 RepID=UPI0003FBD06F|nr:DUF2515 family protein [Paenibacillus taiwanensis]
MSTSKQMQWKALIRFLRQLTDTAYDALKRRVAELSAKWVHSPPHILEWNRAQAQRVEERVRWIVAELDKQRAGEQKVRTIKSTAFSREERDIIHHINRSVQNANRNNITRTTAYGRIYQSYPELHWALLAHMVSRNGGWNMTDLQGEWLPSIMDGEYRHWTYRVLERCNALIFRDAYPQLMLYTLSRRQGKSLFHLLPEFGVSSFMTPFWESFWIQPNSPLLTIALIINEQHVIEGRVVQHPDYQKYAIQRIEFRAHGWLQMNQVIFPIGVPSLEAPLSVVGLTLERFDSLAERIAFGKKLYSLLFDMPEVYTGATRFMRAVPHTGSRADYWPHRFTSLKSSQKHSQSDICSVPAYSPKLEAVWQDGRYAPIEPGDWLHNDGVLHELYMAAAPLKADMTSAHEQMWLELETLAVVTGPSP